MADRDFIHAEANFYRVDGEVWFCIPVSEGHVIGPREATPLDIANHADAFAAFEASEAVAAAAPPNAPTPKKKAPKAKA